MKFEVNNITYDCVENGADKSATVLQTLPTTATVNTATANSDDIQKALEGDWLVTGFGVATGRATMKTWDG